jgi:transcriptional regulator with XRE-family HTH domain/uncharacterized phage-associated protein
MKTELTRKQIGQRIAEIRKKKGYSQEDLAKILDISRPSLTQIELGNRSIDVLELHRLSKVLSFSMDQFMMTDFTSSYRVSSGGETVSEDAVSYVSQERSSVAELDIAKFKNVLMYILEKCAGKPNVGETVLNKLLYFCDFNYFELYEEHLTGASYYKLPYGPVPQKLDYIIAQMIETGQLLRIKSDYLGYPQTRYLPLYKADLSKLKASEKDVIDRVIDHMSDWSAATITNYSHKDMPWLASNDGEEISYELTFYRTTPFSVRNYDEGGEVT